jgi:REP element-mobilizing transposase RayT
MEDKNYHFFISKIKKYLIDTVDVLAYCLMPNHYHLLIQLKSIDLPVSMQKLGLAYAVAFNNINNRSGHLFQGPYQKIHVDELKYLLHLSRYIHLNPVDAKLVYKAEDWEFSSYSEYIGLKKPEFVIPAIILDLFGIGNISTQEEKQTDYRKFIEDWEQEYMSFNLRK